MLAFHFSSPFEGVLGRSANTIPAGIYSVEFGAYGVDTLGKFFCITPGEKKKIRRKRFRNILINLLILRNRMDFITKRGASLVPRTSIVTRLCPIISIRK